MTPENASGSRLLAASQGRQLRLITDLVTVKANSAETGDAFALFETETPAGGGFPPHTQRYEDLGFYVLAGTYVFLIGELQAELGPGGFVMAPRGTLHAYANHGSTTARMLVMALPGGIQEQFVDDAGDDATRTTWEPDMARIMAVAPKYGIEFSSPVATVESGEPPLAPHHPSIPHVADHPFNPLRTRSLS